MWFIFFIITYVVYIFVLKFLIMQYLIKNVIII